MVRLVVISCPNCARAGGPGAEAYLAATAVMMAVPVLMGLGYWLLFRRT